MKRTLIAIMAVLAVMSCTKEVQVKSVEVTPGELTLVVGGKKLLEAKASPAEAVVTTETEWRSSDTQIATVAPTGLVTAVAPGQAVITAVINGVEGICNLTVSDTEINGISIKNGQENALVVNKGDKKELEVEFDPADPTNKTLNWSSSDEQIATVTPKDGGKAEVSFVGTGSVTITATSQVGAKTASQKFAVIGTEPLYILPEGTIYAGRKAAWKLNKTAYPSITNAVWTVNGVEYSGDEVEFAVDVEQSLEDAQAGTEMPKAMISLKAEMEGAQLTQNIEVPVEVFWMKVQIPTWARNSNPVFNKQCTKVYFQTRNSDTGTNKRQLIQIDLETRKINVVDLLVPSNANFTNNGGQFCVNPRNGDVYCCNNHKVFCYGEDMIMKWEYAVPGLSETSGTPSCMVGSGPALSDDASVLFVPLATHKFVAIDASTGAELASLDFSDAADCVDKTVKYTKGLGAVQFAVTSGNLILMHRNINSKSAHWIQYDSAKKTLTITKESNSHTGSLADITAPAVSRDQTKVYFGGSATILHLPVGGYDDAKHLTGAATGLGLHFSLGLTDRYLFGGCSSQGKVMRVDLNANPPALETLFQNGENNRNFDAVSYAEDGCIYTTFKENGALRIVKYDINAEEADMKVIANAPILGGNYQGSANMGGNWFVMCARNAENGEPTVFVRCISSKRAGGWSGMGGDVCSSKNANLVYAE